MNMTCLPTMGLLSPVASVVIGQPFCQGQTGVKHAERERVWQANPSGELMRQIVEASLCLFDAHKGGLSLASLTC